MSHSKRKTPIIGCCGGTDKRDKKHYSKSYRNEVKCLIRKGMLDTLPKRESNRYGGNWNFQKDGKVWISKKERKEDPKIMRK